MTRIRSFIVFSVVAGLMALLATACGDTNNDAVPTAPTVVGDATIAGGSTGAAKADKVDICHRQGNGSYHLINVSANALQAHLNHGDGQPGDLVPDDLSMKFDDACNLVPASIQTTVFIASPPVPGGLAGRFFGDFGGLAAADQACTALANAAGLQGSYVAWLSDSANDAKDRIPQIGPYVRVDGAVIAVDLADLTDGQLAAAINRDETNQLVDFRLEPYTGTKPDGTKETFIPPPRNVSTTWCQDWTTRGGEGGLVRMGSNNQSGPSWTLGAVRDCSQGRSLYCFGR